MDKNKEAQFDFCPKCGALARDGICTSCGFGKEKTEIDVSETTPVAEAEAPVVAPVNAVQYTAPVSYTNPNPYNSANANPYTTNNVYSNNAYIGNASTPANTYGEYQNYTAYTNGAIPTDMQVKKKNRKVWVIVGVCIGIVLLLIILLCVAVGQLVSKIDNASSTYGEDFWDDYYEEDYDYGYDYDYDYSYDDYYEEDYDYDDFYNNILERAKENQSESGDEYTEDESMVSPDGKTYGYDPEDDYYYQLKDIIREDLTYSVYFDYEEFTEGEDAYVYCVYPVLEGNIPNIDYLNEVIYDEYLYFVDYYTENVKESMSEGDYYSALTEGYVTYMDEEKISIVFREDVASSDNSLVSLYCINIDVEKGVIINNTEMLDADDAFSVDFRIREAEQNQSDVLDYYTDQEITEMLNEPFNLIVFYTPLGLEVGLNHDFGFSTATYKDYKNYLKQF